MSTRRYGVGLEPVGETVTQSATATSRSAVSRRFVKMTETALADLLAADLSALDLVAFMVDGVHFAESCCVVALGIDIDGVKHPLALVEGSTENTTLVTELCVGLRERGPGPHQADPGGTGRVQGVAPGCPGRVRPPRHGAVSAAQDPQRPRPPARTAAGPRRQVFLVNGRAQFEFVVTEASLREVDARGHRAYAQWVRDVLDTWLIQSAREPAHLRTEVFAEPRFGNLSVKDRRLLQDALDWGCQAFLTMERRLPTASVFVERATGLRVMRPTVYWRLLAPWAALYC